MKKHMLPILLACQLIVSLAMTGFAATDQVTYPIGSISPVGYLLDDDSSRVDFADSANVIRVRYGETVYFPLLNNGAAAQASVDQLLARSSMLEDEVKEAQAFTASLEEDYEIARRDLLNAVHAAVLSGDQIKTAVEELLAAIENETPDGVAAREQRITALNEEIAQQKAVLDSAVELDSAAARALSEKQDELAWATGELDVLRTLLQSVEAREQQREALMTLTDFTLDSAYDTLNEASAAMIDPSLTTGTLKARRSDAIDQRDEVRTDIQSILDELNPGVVTEDNERTVLTPYVSARNAYLAVLNDHPIDSGVSDYLDDPDPQEDAYEPEIIDYGDAIQALLFTYRGVLSYSRESSYDARSLADALTRLGYETTGQDQNGTLYERQNYWDERIEEIEQELSASRLRDEAKVNRLVREQSRLETSIDTLDQQISAAAKSLIDAPEDLTPPKLARMTAEWEERIDAQNDRCRALEQDAAYYSAERQREQQDYQTLTGQLAILTDPDAPSALTRAIRFRQGYPFLRFSQSLREADSIEALCSCAVIEELETLVALFSESYVNQGCDSDPALLEALRPYESYLAAKSVYDPLRESNTELLRSALAARLAFTQSDPDSVKYPYIYENKAVDGVHLKSKWEEGKSYVKSISLVKKRYQQDSGYTGMLPSEYIYFIALALKERDTTSASSVDLYGTISMKKTSKSDSLNQFDYDDMKLDINLELGFEKPEDANLIPIDPATFYPDEDFDENDEETFDFEADSDSYYVANTNNQKKLVLGMNTDYDEEIGDLYADQTANLSFFNGNGGSFSRSGYLYLAADEDSFLYRVNDRGSLVTVNAEYDDHEGCFVIRTHTLGQYIVSDLELALIDAQALDPEEITVVVVGPDETGDEPTSQPTAPAKPSPSWSTGSRSDEDEAPVSASSSPAPAAQPSEPEASSSPEELSTAGGGDISIPLLIGASIAGALILTLIVFLIIGAKSKKPRG